MNEWGIPDWRDPARYGSTESWTRSRWRWEFLRRRDDVRAAFDQAAESTYRHNSQFAGRDGFPVAHLQPNEPGFIAVHPLALRVKLPGLPNPRIGEQPSHAISFREWDDSLIAFHAPEAPDGFHRIDFDLGKPLEPQLQRAKSLLKELQEFEHGKPLQRRRHPKQWLTYLRILDGRAEGNSWADLTGILPFRNGTEQAARDAWEQADVLRFNF